jgi:hypothetical protein
MFSLAMDLMSVLLMSLRSQTCEIWYGNAAGHTHTHTLGMNYCSRFNVYNMATVQTFDVTANKCNVYRIPNDVISYAYKKCADKQNNNRSRDFVAKGGRSTSKSAS